MDRTSVNETGPDTSTVKSEPVDGSGAMTHSNVPVYVPGWQAVAPAPGVVSGQSNWALGSRSARGLKASPVVPAEDASVVPRASLPPAPAEMPAGMPVLG